MTLLIATPRPGRWVVLALCLGVFVCAVAGRAGAEEDVLRLLVWEGYAPPEYVREFEKQIEAQHGRKVKLEVSYVGGPDDFFPPIRMKRVDLVTISHHYFKDERFNYIHGKLILPIETQRLENFSNVIPALRKSKYLAHQGKTYGVPVCQGPYGLAYNPAKVASPPETWQVLWDPKHKGQYVLGRHEYLYNVATTALACGYPRDAITRYDDLNNKEFKAKLRQLAVGAGGFWVGQDSPEDLSGKSLAAVWGDSLPTLEKRGQPWRIAEPKEATLCWVDNYAITWALADKPFLRKVAHQWIDRLLQPDYQVDYILRTIALGPVTTDIEEKLTPAEKKRLHVGTANFFRENRILPPTCSRRDRNGLKLLWTEAMEGIDA